MLWTWWGCLSRRSPGLPRLASEIEIGGRGCFAAPAPWVPPGSRSNSSNIGPSGIFLQPSKVAILPGTDHDLAIAMPDCSSKCSLGPGASCPMDRPPKTVLTYDKESQVVRRRLPAWPSPREGRSRRVRSNRKRRWPQQITFSAVLLTRSQKPIRVRSDSRKLWFVSVGWEREVCYSVASLGPFVHYLTNTALSTTLAW